jgi:lysophospholipase L1-like esterase
VYRPFGAVTVLPEHVYPIRSGAGHVVTRTTRGRVPRTLRALERGEQVTVVCLGDSITAGGDASSPAGAYVSLFEDGLRRRFPQADLRVVNISIGGTRSAQWVHNGSYPGLPRLPAEKCTLDRVTEAGPDLVTVEFLNDVTLDRDELPRIYGALLDRLCGTGAEVILITPSFAEPGIMGAESLGAGDSARFPHYVAFLWGLAEREGVALADASSRWESLRAEGLPYMTLLRNHHNHPGDRGHRLFSEELLKCFEHE